MTKKEKKMPNKSYDDISVYFKALQRLKTTLSHNKSWKVVEIKHIEESEYIKDKVRVVIEAGSGKFLWDFFTEYKVFDGDNWELIKLDIEYIKNKLNEIIKRGE